MSLQDRRRDNARLLARENDGLAGFARTIERSQAYVSKIIGKNPSAAIGDKAARHIEEMYRVPVGWLDEVHSPQNAEGETHYVRESASTYMRAKESVPLLSTGDIHKYLVAPSTVEDYMLDRSPCPFDTTDMAFAIIAPSDAMHSPSGGIQSGSIVYVEPNIKPKQGAIILVETAGFADIRRLQVDMGTWVAVADNTNYGRYTIEQTQVLGVVTASATTHKF